MSFETRKGYEPVIIILYDKKRDIQVEEISLLAFDSVTSKVLAVGKQAIPFQSSANPHVVVHCPLRYGVIADYEEACAMFQGLLQNAAGIKPFHKPKLVVCVPAGVTAVERKAFQDAFYQAGAKEVSITEESIETVRQSLPPSQILVGIGWNPRQDQTLNEKWNAIQKGKIPPGSYPSFSIESQDPDVTITLLNSPNRVAIRFRNASFLQIQKKGGSPEIPGSEQIPAQDFPALFQAENQEGGSVPRQAYGGQRRYLLKWEAHCILVYADDGPDVQILS